MRILFVISTIALIALLWASISIASHVRRARRRRRAQAEQAKATLPDRTPFNKDLGDLSDPYEERRTKPKGPSRL
jgi:hypothetical protein